MASQIPSTYTRIMAPPANFNGAQPGRPSTTPVTPGAPPPPPPPAGFSSSNGGYSVGAPAPPAGFAPPLHAPYMNPPPPPAAVMPGTSLPGQPPPAQAAPPPPSTAPQSPTDPNSGTSLPGQPAPSSLNSMLGLGGRPYIHDFTPDHLATLAPGQQVDTKFGTVSRDPTGKVALRLSDAGQQHYARAHAEETAKYGAHPLAGIPGAPQPPIEPGKPNLNPFTGQWTDGWSHHKLGR